MLVFNHWCTTLPFLMDVMQMQQITESDIKLMHVYNGIHNEIHLINFEHYN